ncbi:XRE family transcriptional regulator [Janthinobacterium sp. 78]|uniref:XRE family transcriptional regulator n=1 Tax=Janthinobacterium sp. 78 TaxID=2135631 RepID=UPI000D5DC9B6|nr:XRE family transcriptional regulator [Janthinobacterium sp. 78]PVX38176.1 hypothetical protein C8C92_4845 [Janthinobacterium sp. 78]
MTTTGYTRHQTLSFARQLATNVRNALHVAGPADAAGNTRPLRSVALQQRTGIARSTLRALTDSSSEAGPNPDLHTLSRLAEALDMPLAFLLMRPKDWRTLCQAINNMRDPMCAAEKLIVHTELPVLAGIPERVMRECSLQPESVPYGLSADSAEMARIMQRNEQRRRTSHVLGSLMLRGSLDRDAKVLLTALAASLTHQLSYDGQVQSDHQQS